MPSHVDNREAIVQALRAEVLGPCPIGEELDCSGLIVFETPAQAVGPWRQKGSGEEILTRDKPRQRYGAGVLYPLNTPGEPDPSEEPLIEVALHEEAEEPALPPEAVATAIEVIQSRPIPRDLDKDAEMFDLSLANSFRPSSMGVSFLAYLPDGAELSIEVSGGRYQRKEVRVGDRPRDWWLRLPVVGQITFEAKSLAGPEPRSLVRNLEGECFRNLKLRLEILSRPYGEDSNQRLLTVCLVNRGVHDENRLSEDEHCLFQSEYRIQLVGGTVLPYPGPPHEELDEEEQSLALLYRHVETYACGHGCAANWGSDREGHPTSVSAEAMPSVETPTVTPTIRRPDGSELEIPMAPLAGLVPGDDGFSSLDEVLTLYRAWIAEQRRAARTLVGPMRAVAHRHLDACEACAERMSLGLAYLRSDTLARRAFQLANHAILLQQLRTRREARSLTIESETYTFSEPAPDPELLAPDPVKGKWRPFQIAFLLMALRSTVDGHAPDRDRVELIWFPTGGGKTEAYLGLTAFAIFMRRLRDPNDTGVQTLMRYTLRLLTAQQFQRASALICAMETLRRREPKVQGHHPYGIGIWLGGATTPNKRKQAIEFLRKLQRGERGVSNPFLLNRCPWCAAQMGPVRGAEGRARRNQKAIAGYVEREGTVVFQCTDPRCDFSEGLPILVIDEDIYKSPPDLLIGTVDKFARLAWEPNARAIFGLDEAGRRVHSPPGLIIQDELHLISGPLGSTVGLYEPVIEALCSDLRGNTPVRPKIVSSTATIRRFGSQIKALYARDQVTLFPPPGLEAGDSFFARYARDAHGVLEPGRLYVGLHAPGLGSLLTLQVRSYAALLQAPTDFGPEARDPWWTLLAFYSSIKELGTTVSLFQTTIPQHLVTLRNRLGLAPERLRYVNVLRELTARLDSEEVPKMIAALEVPTTSSKDKAVDVCLASNIIEVGVDIDRLSLMCVVGQPKTTSQYIQVTGRVGRRPWERPGLVVTLFSPTRPRDRSHYEKFRSYHERLYAQVEPTSVTPFSPPLLERALHATMAAYVRQLGSRTAIDRPFPVPEALLEQLLEIMRARVRLIDPQEAASLEAQFATRLEEWRTWEPVIWDDPGAEEDGNTPLLHMAGKYINRLGSMRSWPTPSSMRNVDASCELTITHFYS